MSAAAAFLRAMAKAFSTMTLYREGHPSRERALDDVYERLLLLQDDDPRARFTFIGDEIVYGDHPLREMAGWDWAPRLGDAGVQRLEFTGPVERHDLEVFLDRVHRRLTEGDERTSEVRQTRTTHIKFGVVGLEDEDEDDRPGGVATATLDFTLEDEADTVRWIHREMKERGELHLLEAHSIVRALSVAMHADQAYLIPLLRLRQYDEYTTAHALNLSTLTMALAEFVGLGPKEVRTFGIAGLLHDLGKVRVPDEILNKPGKLSEEERRVMDSHTVEGARIILETEEILDVAAIVAYEHHLQLDGGGYPELHYPRSAHRASALVHVCDVFDALRTDRPYRDAWPTERVLTYIEAGAGSEFEPKMAEAFVRMMRRWSGRVAELDGEDAALPIGDNGANGNGTHGHGANGNGSGPAAEIVDADAPESRGAEDSPDG